jgi:hypothetical protein
LKELESICCRANSLDILNTVSSTEQTTADANEVMIHGTYDYLRLPFTVRRAMVPVVTVIHASDSFLIRGEPACASCPWITLDQPSKPIDILSLAVQYTGLADSSTLVHVRQVREQIQ